jgi:predicted nucleic acid-binding protein
MRIDRYVAVLDACVLAPMPIADTLLRLAEQPAFYSPKWSAEILDELQRTLRKKFKYTAVQVERRLTAMRTAFPDAGVHGHQDLIESMKNDAKDRHVLAAAVRCGADVIVSDNKKHFARRALSPYGIECMTADEFIEQQYNQHPDSFISMLVEQAANIGWTLPRLIANHVPCLSRLIVTTG